MSEFRERIYDIVRVVPAGRVTTYGDVAAVAGAPRAARQVGYALSALPPDTDVPWQRVINAGGRVSGRGQFLRADAQEQRLEQEGIAFDPSGRCALELLRYDFPEFA